MALLAQKLLKISFLSKSVSGYWSDHYFFFFFGFPYIQGSRPLFGTEEGLQFGDADPSSFIHTDNTFSKITKKKACGNL